jgi:hypothetical protein
LVFTSCSDRRRFCYTDKFTFNKGSVLERFYYINAFRRNNFTSRKNLRVSASLLSCGGSEKRVTVMSEGNVTNPKF